MDELTLAQRTEEIVRNLELLNSPNNAERVNSEKYLYQFFVSESFAFVFLVSRLALRDDVPVTTIHAALVCVGRALRSDSPARLAAMRREFLDPKHRQACIEIQQGLFRFIMSQTLVMRLAASNCLWLLVRVLQSEGYEIFAGLFTVASSSSSTEEARHGAICATREILAADILPPQLIQRDVGLMYGLITSILSVGAKEGNELVYTESCKTFPLIVKMMMINEQSEEDVQRLLNIVESIIATAKFEVFEPMLDSLVYVFKGVYGRMTEALAKRIVMIGGAALNSGSTECQIVALSAWQRMARYEKKAERNIQLIKMCVPLLFPVLCGFMGSLSPDIDVSNIDYAAVPFEAFDCLSSLCSVAPEAVVGCMHKLYAQGAKTWGDHAAIILGVTAIIDADCRKYEQVHGFLNQVSPVFFACAKSSTKLAFFVFRPIAKLIADYGIGADAQSLEIVFNYDVHRHPVMVVQSLAIVDGLCEASSVEDEGSIIAIHVDGIMTSLKRLMRHQDLDVSSRAVMSMAFVVAHLPPSRMTDLCDAALVVVGQFTEQLISTGIIGNPMSLPLVSALLDVLDAIAKRLRNNVAPLADRIMNILFTLVERAESVLEEIRGVVTQMSFALGEAFAPYSHAVVTHVEKMIATGNAGIMTSGLEIVCSLIVDMPMSLRISVPRIWELLRRSSEVVGAGIHFDVNLLKTISTLSVNHSPGGVEWIHPLHARIGSVVGQLVNQPNAVRKECLGEIFSVLEYVLSVGNAEFLAANKDTFFVAIAGFVERPIIDRKVVMPFFALLRMMGTKFTKLTDKLKLTQRKLIVVFEEVRVVLKDDPRVVEAAAETLTFLRKT